MCEDGDGPNARKPCIANEKNEELVVSSTNAIVYPWTVVIHLQDARPASFAMVGALWPEGVALDAPPLSGTHAADLHGIRAFCSSIFTQTGRAESVILFTHLLLQVLIQEIFGNAGVGPHALQVTRHLKHHNAVVQDGNATPMAELGDREKIHRESHRQSGAVHDGGAEDPPNVAAAPAKPPPAVRGIGTGPL